MKKLIVLFLALVMIGSILPVSAITSKGSLGKVPLYKGSIGIDGKKDAIYDKGLILEGSAWNDSFKPNNCTAKCYFLHDGKYLYLFVDAQSGYKLDDYNAKYKGERSWETTCVEIMIDWANKAAGEPDCYKIKSWFTSEIWYDLKSMSGKTEFKATVDKSKNSFTMEYKLEMQDGATTGKEVGFNVMVDFDTNMGPDKNASRKILGIQPGHANDGENFKNLILTSDEVKASAATTAAPAATTKAAATTAAKAAVTASAKTADTSVVLAAVLVSVAAAAVGLKKKH